MIIKLYVVFVDEFIGVLDLKLGVNFLGYLCYCVDDLGQMIIMVIYDVKVVFYVDCVFMLLDGCIVDDIVFFIVELVSEVMVGLEG